MKQPVKPILTVWGVELLLSPRSIGGAYITKRSFGKLPTPKEGERNPSALDHEMSRDVGSAWGKPSALVELVV